MVMDGYQSCLAIIFLFFYKRECLDLFEYLIIFLGICNPPIRHALGYYMKESHEGGPKMLARDLKPRISCISLSLRNY